MAKDPPRGARPLALSDAVKRAVVALHLVDGIPLTAEIDASLVESVEVATGCRFADDVLVLLVSRSDGLEENGGLALARVVENTRQARARGCPADLVAIGRHPDGLAYYCVERNPGEVVIHEFDNRSRTVERETSLADWLEAILEDRREFLSEGDDEQRACSTKQPTEAEVAAFTPRLVLKKT
jgi:hypothetical protein